MAKKNISKIINSGSLHKRLLLYFENSCRMSFGESPILTKSEATALYNSTKTPAENIKWNEFLESYGKIHQAINNLLMKYQIIAKDYAHFMGLLFLWGAYESMELLANSILHETKDPKERTNIAQNAIGYDNLISSLFLRPGVDKEGYIDLNSPKRNKKRKKYDFEDPELMKYKNYRLREFINGIRETAEKDIVEFLSLRQAILEYMEETGVNIKLFKQVIDNHTELINEPIIEFSNKYRSDKEYFYEGMEGLNTRLNKLKHIYNVTPNPKELRPDQDRVKTIKKRQFYYEI